MRGQLQRGARIGRTFVKEQDVILTATGCYLVAKNPIDGAIAVNVADGAGQALCYLRRRYQSASGVTADFNLNLLTRLNKELDADFDQDAFMHNAYYNEELQRIEMHLVSKSAQSVRCNGSYIQLAEGETIHTENSYKYTVEGFADLAASAGLTLRQSWLDSQRLFSVHYLSTA